MRRGVKAGAACSLVALAVLGAASQAAASVTIGRIAPGPSASCAGSSSDLLEPNVSGGTGYVVPALPPASALVISSWSHNAAPPPPPGNQAALTFDVFRKVSDPATYMVVAQDGPQQLQSGSLNTFPVHIPVDPGDVIGLNSAASAYTACTFPAVGESYLVRNPSSLSVGATGDFLPGSSDRTLNVSAVVSPSNSFSTGYPHYPRNGTATVGVILPNPGQVTVSGKGARAAGSKTKSIGAPGTVKFTIRAKGAKRAKLIRTGHVKVTQTITYTPTGGEVSTQPLKLRLRL